MGTDDGTIQAVKAGRNQSLCREVNERIEAIADQAGYMEFICECANLECTATVTMSVAEYERIRSSSVRFPVAVGHDFPEVENVVEVSDGYAIVQKRGKAAEISDHLDPLKR